MLLVSLAALVSLAHAVDGWSAEVSDLVEAFPAAAEQAPAPVVVFDFDNTMILGDISHTGLVVQARQSRYGFDPAVDNDVHPGSLTALFRARQHAVDKTEVETAIEYGVLLRYSELKSTQGKVAALQYLARSLKGLTVDQVRSLATDTLAVGEATPVCTAQIGATDSAEPINHAQGIRRRPAISAMVGHLAGKGYEVWVVSASPERLVEGVASIYGIPPERVLGVRTEEVDDRLTAEVLPPVTWRGGKVQAIEREIGRRPVLVFGDAWTDYEMLTWAEHGVLIDRSDEELNAALRAEGVHVQPRFEGERDPTAACAESHP